MYKIGEFARLAQVSVHLLRHYDDIGLFAPHHIDIHSGYRYYSADQLPRLNRILALRALGLSLEHVALMVNDAVSASDIEGMLRLRKAQIEDLLRQEIVRLKQVEMRLNLIQHEDDSGLYDVVLKSMPAREGFATRHVLPGYAGFQALYDRVLQGVKHLLGQGTLFAADHQPSEHHDMPDIEIGVLFERAPTDAVTTLTDHRALAQVAVPHHPQVASVTYAGRRGGGAAAYQAAAAWIEHSGFVFNGPVYEFFLVPDDPDHVVFELQIPVKHA